MQERLQKILAHAGVASRRAAELLVTGGRVRVNGRIVTELGSTADPRKDKIEVDGKRVVREDPQYILLHKPREVVSTLSDPEGRQHLGQVIARMGLGRLYPVGRLDFHTSGALLLTNDGELTDALLHPRRDVPKIYVAKLKGTLEIADLDALRNGVVLDDGERTKPADVFVTHDDARSTLLQITLYEGRNRQIHRMGEAIGHPVLRLVRISFAGLEIEGLRPGQWRELTNHELEKLNRDYVTPARKAKDEGNGPGQLAVDEPRVRVRSVDSTVARSISPKAEPKRASARVPSRTGTGRGASSSDDLRGESRPQRDDAKQARSRNEAPRSRNEAPRSKNEAPRSRNEAPRSKNEAPRSRNEAKNEAPRASDGGRASSGSRAKSEASRSKSDAPRSKSDGPSSRREPAGRSQSTQRGGRSR